MVLGKLIMASLEPICIPFGADSMSRQEPSQFGSCGGYHLPKYVASIGSLWRDEPCTHRDGYTATIGCQCAIGRLTFPVTEPHCERLQMRERRHIQNSIFSVCFSRSSLDSIRIVSRTSLAAPGTEMRISTAPSFTGNLSFVLNLMACLY